MIVKNLRLRNAIALIVHAAIANFEMNRLIVRLAAQNARLSRTKAVARVRPSKTIRSISRSLALLSQRNRRSQGMTLLRMHRLGVGPELTVARRTVQTRTQMKRSLLLISY